MIFSRRNKISKDVEEWCKERRVPATGVNVITALDSLGLLVDDELPLPIIEADSFLKERFHTIQTSSKNKNNPNI